MGLARNKERANQGKYQAETQVESKREKEKKSF